MHNIAENFKNDWRIVEDDQGYDVRYTATNLEGDVVRSLPLYFTKEFRDKTQASIDFSSSLIALASSLNRAHHLAKVVDAIEIGSALMKDRIIQ